MQKNTVRKYRRGEGNGKSVTEVLEELSLDEMFNKFMTFKQTEGLALERLWNIISTLTT